MSTVNNITEKLQAFYKTNGLDPNCFNCKNKNLCPPPKGYSLARGMQCHIGSKYGEDGKMKILVASLDCGGGGKGTINERTTKVRSDANGDTRNLHMRGTFQALSYFLEDDHSKWIHPEASKLVEYMIMINTCKCCKIGSTAQMEYKYFLNCAENTIGEILRIEPDVILFQGKNSYIGCRKLLSPIEGIEDEEIKQSLRVFDYQGLKCYAVLCIHPSARFKYAKVRERFYHETLPKIANYIKNHPIQ